MCRSARVIPITKKRLRLHRCCLGSSPTHLDPLALRVRLSADGGYPSIRLAEACPNASILCDEANPEKVKTIYQNFDARNIRSVDVVQKAFWIESGAVEFQIPSKANEKETIHVQAVRLRDLLKSASFDLVRLNVSNAILLIIHDCGELLQKGKHWILHFPSDAGNRDQLILLLAELSVAGFHMQINRVAVKTNDESKLEILMTAELTGGIEDCTPSCTHLGWRDQFDCTGSQIGEN